MEEIQQPKTKEEQRRLVKRFQQPTNEEQSQISMSTHVHTSNYTLLIGCLTMNEPHPQEHYCMHYSLRAKIILEDFNLVVLTPTAKLPDLIPHQIFQLCSILAPHFLATHTHCTSIAKNSVANLSTDIVMCTHLRVPCKATLQLHIYQLVYQ